MADIRSLSKELYDLAERGDFLNQPSSLSFEHIWWMIEQIETGKVEGEKAHRWLGWIQCAIVLSGAASLEKMKNINREYL